MRNQFASFTAVAFAMIFSISSALASPPTKTWDRDVVQTIQHRYWEKARWAYFLTESTSHDDAMGNTYKTLTALDHAESSAAQLGMALEDDASVTGPERSMDVWTRVLIDSGEVEMYYPFSRLHPDAIDAIQAALAVREELRAYYGDDNWH